MAIDPAFLAALGALIDRYGLPLAILVFLVVALARRFFVLGSELERTVAAYRAELDYREARRVEEREGRLAAEAALKDLSGSVNALSGGLESHDEKIISVLEEIRRKVEDVRGPRR